ncbi:MAG: PEP-CTERM sorting domain-containing protein [Pirellulaceae bacterium]|nr:PEP-CTERM sorting domain-containing protein [Planctomycetales bacterium]
MRTSNSAATRSSTERSRPGTRTIYFMMAIALSTTTFSCHTSFGQVKALSGTAPLAGNQAFDGNLGMDFVVNLPIQVTGLAVYDDNQDGIDPSHFINVEIWQRDDNGTPSDFTDDFGTGVLASDTFQSGSDGTLDGVYRIKNLTSPLTLQPGAYTINANGYGAAERLFNSGGNTAIAPVVNNSGGAFEFVGASRYGLQGPGTFPETPDGGPGARYFAGNFLYEPPSFDAFASLEIDRATGAAHLVNGTNAPVNIISYSIESANQGALSSANWKSITDNYDANSGQAVDGDDNWLKLSAAGSNSDLSEAQLSVGGGNGATLNSLQRVDLGTGVWVQNPNESDISFRYAKLDGTIVNGIVRFIGNGGQPYEFGDLNFDGTAFAIDDFTDVMQANLVSSVSGTSAAEAYQLGDLDQDADVDRDDFRLFKESYLAAGGSAAALDAAIANVPEPSSLALVVLACASAMVLRSPGRSVKRNSMIPAAMIGMLCVGLNLRDTSAQTIALDNPLVTGVQNFGGDLGMDFDVREFDVEVVSLGAFDSAQDGWFSDITVELWSRDDAGTAAPGDDTGITILASDVFSSADAGTLVGGSRFKNLASPLTLTPGSYTIVARGYSADELLGNNGFGGPNAGTPTPAINGAGGIIRFVGTSRYGTNDSFPDTPDSGPANRYNAGTFQFNVDIDPLVLEVNTTTGAMTFRNEGANTFNVDFYEIRSPGGTLNANGWNSLADQGVAGWGEGGQSDDMLLVEANLTDSTVFGTGANRAIGNGYSAATDARDLQFLYVTSSGIEIDGIVRYVQGSVLQGDYNKNGTVDAADYTVWKDNFGSTSNLAADGNGNGTVDAADYTVWKDNFGNTGSVSSVAAVPEASTGVLAMLAVSIASICTRRRRRLTTIVGALVVYAAVTEATQASVTLDRQYLFGDDTEEHASSGITVGTGAGNVSPNATLDSVGPTGAYVDAVVHGSPSYVDVSVAGGGLSSARPGAVVGSLGIRFNGVSDYLETARLGWPQTSISSTVAGGPIDYTGIVNRGFQLWVYPEAAGNGQAQDVVMDTADHGVAISETGTWVMRYRGVDVDSGVNVNFGQWNHVMVGVTSGLSGPQSGSRLYVDGVAVAARTGGYGNEFVMAIGANTGDGVDVLPGSERFFNGVLDDLELFVAGRSTDTQMDYGTFDLTTDNHFVASSITGIDGDVNQDGLLDQADINALVAGWKHVNLVNGIPTGDLVSLSQGDLNFDGRTHIEDVVLLHQALVAAGGAGFDLSLLSGVPEPSAVAMLCTGLTVLLGRRRRMLVTVRKAK